MKQLRDILEGLLDPGFDIQDPSPLSQELFKILNKYKPAHLDGIVWKQLLYKDDFKDDVRNVLDKYARKISRTTATKKTSVAYYDTDQVVFIFYRGSKYCMFNFRQIRRSSGNKDMNKCIEYSTDRFPYHIPTTKQKYFVIDEDVFNVLFQPFKNYWKDL